MLFRSHVLLETAKSVGIKLLIHVSTDEVYGSCNGERKTEASVLNPTNPYAASKAAAEQIVRGYINSFYFPAIITRGNNVYGPRQYPEKLIPKFILRLKDNKPCCIHGSGTNRRHFIHVDDVVRAFDLIVHRGVLGETYNIGSQYEYENIEVAKAIISNIKKGDRDDTWIEWEIGRAHV